jgi:hypothetical protein
MSLVAISPRKPAILNSRVWVLFYWLSFLSQAIQRTLHHRRDFFSQAIQRTLHHGRVPQRTTHATHRWREGIPWSECAVILLKQLLRFLSEQFLIPLCKILFCSNSVSRSARSSSSRGQTTRHAEPSLPSVLRTVAPQNLKSLSSTF